MMSSVTKKSRLPRTATAAHGLRIDQRVTRRVAGGSPALDARWSELSDSWALVIFITANNRFHRSIVSHSFFTKRTCFDFLRMGRSSLRANNKFPRSIMIWVWVWLAWLGTFCMSPNFSFWLSSNFWTQFSFPAMFEGNLWRRPRWRIYLLVYDFSNFHPNNFRDTISWECFLKNDCVRSRLIELQSFLQSKVDVDPHALCMYCARRGASKSIVSGSLCSLS